MKRKLILLLISFTLILAFISTPVMAATNLLDDFNRSDGSLGSSWWTDVKNTMEISNNEAQAGILDNWCGAIYNSGTGTVLEGDVQYYGNQAFCLSFVGFLMNYTSNSDTLLVKVQDNTASGNFNSVFCYYGFWPDGGSLEKYWYFADEQLEPFTSAHMKVELVESTITITFSNIDGGPESYTFVWENVPATDGTGVGITGYKQGTNRATIDNFSGTGTPVQSGSPGWNSNGKKKGWDGSKPPGLDKQDKTPPGFSKGKKSGWDNATN